MRFLFLLLILTSCNSLVKNEKALNRDHSITLQKYFFLDCTPQHLVQLEPEELWPTDTLFSHIVLWSEKNSERWEQSWSKVELGEPYIIVKQSNISILVYDDVIKYMDADAPGSTRYMKNNHLLFDKSWKKIEPCR
ncbi:MAG: hypothetical protein ACI837_002056 [Crocinitomicaceae bacterium]|jgi:hypothetical protein